MGHVERHAVQRHNRMICFDDGPDRFQVRAAVIALRDGRVLVQNIKGVDVTFLPGGRIDQNETTAEAVVREIEEEFGRTVAVGPLLYVIETFYPEKGQDFHEIDFYYGMTVPPDFPYDETAICHRCHEGPVEMEFRWLPATAAALTAAAFYPVPLRGLLLTPPASTVHIVNRETA
jgi:8-oxo-dGTP pyrophosphatase MutT (NUDIX family)